MFIFNSYVKLPEGVCFTLSSRFLNCHFLGVHILGRRKNVDQKHGAFYKGNNWISLGNSCKKIVFQGKFGFSWEKHMMFHWENSYIIEKIKYFMVKQNKCFD